MIDVLQAYEDDNFYIPFKNVSVIVKWELLVHVYLIGTEGEDGYYKLPLSFLEQYKTWLLTQAQ